MQKSPRLYFAGPDIFRADVADWAAEIRAACVRSGVVALLPVDGSAVTPQGICHGNLDLLRSADAVLANLNPFRGHEPDSGTVFETGFAVALGKRVIGYLDDIRPLRERLAGQEALARAGDGQWRDTGGLQVEDFGLPVNLMLACSLEIVAGGYADALRHFAPGY